MSYDIGACMQHRRVLLASCFSCFERRPMRPSLLLAIWVCWNHSNLFLDAICYLPGDSKPYPLEQRVFNGSFTEERLLLLHARISSQLRNMTNSCGHNHYTGYSCLWFVAPNACSLEHKHPKILYEDEELRSAAVYLNNPCFTAHSWGNNFGSYVESILCAKLSGTRCICPPFLFRFTRSTPLPLVIMNFPHSHFMPGAHFIAPVLFDPTSPPSNASLAFYRGLPTVIHNEQVRC